jgi:hypothetical protein
VPPSGSIRTKESLYLLQNGTKENIIGEITQTHSFLKGLIEGAVTAKVSSSQKQRWKEDRIGESQLFKEQILSVNEKTQNRWESILQPSTYKAKACKSKLTRLVS